MNQNYKELNNKVKIQHVENIVMSILYPSINIEYLDNYDFSKYNEIQHEYIGDCCFDLRAAIDDPFNLMPTKTHWFPTGIKIELPNNNFFEMQIRSKCKLADKYKIVVSNGIGTLNSKYRGEIFVILVNNGSNSYRINPGDQIAQAKIAFVPKLNFNKIDKVPETFRSNIPHSDIKQHI